MAIILNGQTNDVTIGGVSVATESEVSSAISTTLGNVSTTELGYLDGVTSNIQAQLNAKQETLISATNIKTVNGNSLLGSGDVVISSTPTSAQVGAATAGLAAGAVGTYATMFEYGNDLAYRAFGSTLAGSSLSPGGVRTGYTNYDGTYYPSGTWMLVGGYSTTTSVNDMPVALWLRIA